MSTPWTQSPTWSWSTLVTMPSSGARDDGVGQVELGAIERRLGVLHRRVLVDRKVGIAAEAGERAGDVLFLRGQLLARDLVGVIGLIVLRLRRRAG